MTEKELFKAAAQLDMPDFEDVRRACLEQKSAKRPFRYKRYIAAAACLALILIAVPAVGNFGANSTSGTMSAASYSGSAAATEDTAPADEDIGTDTNGADGADGAGQSASGSIADSAGQSAPGPAADSAGKARTIGDTGETAGTAAEADSGNTAAVAPNSVAPSSLAEGGAEYSFTQLDSAPAQSYFALDWSDFTAMTAEEMEQYFGVPLLPVSAPEGYAEATDDSAFGVYRDGGGDVYYDAATRSYASGGSEYDFTTYKHTLLVLPELSGTVINGYSVELYKWSFQTGSGAGAECFGARWSSGDTTYSITGTDVTEEEFVSVLLAQIGG